MRRPHGHARIDEENPEQTALCDRCSRLWNRSSLAWQFEWAGLTMTNRRILVCEDCLDEPAPFLRTIILPPDPPPSYNIRQDGLIAIDGSSVWTLQAPPGSRIFKAVSGMSVKLQLN
jgi:hypothetical protein